MERSIEEMKFRDAQFGINVDYKSADEIREITEDEFKEQNKTDYFILNKALDSETEDEIYHVVAYFIAKNGANLREDVGHSINKMPVNEINSLDSFLTLLNLDNPYSSKCFKDSKFQFWWDCHPY